MIPGYKLKTINTRKGNHKLEFVKETKHGTIYLDIDRGVNELFYHVVCEMDRGPYSINSLELTKIQEVFDLLTRGLTHQEIHEHIIGVEQGLILKSPRGNQGLPGIKGPQGPMGNDFLTYGQALAILKNGGKVSCKRWGTEGKTYIMVKDFTHITKDLPLSIILVDTTRNKTVNFTPSVENQLEDVWYEV